MSFYQNKPIHFNSQKLNNNKSSELGELLIIQEKMELDIQKLWENVIVPYLENYTERQILFGLRTDDCEKFHKYMIQNNEICSYVVKRIVYLQDN